MEAKWYHLLAFVIVGILIGFFLDFPNKFEIVFVVPNETQEWVDGAMIDMENLSYKFNNMCCYPENCEQAKNNPDLCTCRYMVECFNQTKDLVN